MRALFNLRAVARAAKLLGTGASVDPAEAS